MLSTVGMVEVQLQHLVDQGVQLGQIHQRGIGHDTVAAAVPVNNINIVSGLGIQDPLFFFVQLDQKPGFFFRRSDPDPYPLYFCLDPTLSVLILYN